MTLNIEEILAADDDGTCPWCGLEHELCLAMGCDNSNPQASYSYMTQLIGEMQ